MEEFKDFLDFREKTGGSMEDWIEFKLKASQKAEAEESPEEREERLYREAMKDLLKGRNDGSSF